MAIATNRALANPANAKRLPPSMRTLAELAPISPPVLEGYIKDGIVHVAMERKDAEALKRVANPKRDGRSRPRLAATIPATPLTLLELQTASTKPSAEAMDAKAKAEAERETERLAKAEASEPERRHTPTPLMAVHVLIAHLRRYGISELPHADLLELFNTLDQAFEAAKPKAKTKGKPATAAPKSKAKATKPLTAEAKAVIAEVERDLNAALFGSPKSKSKTGPKTGSKTTAKTKRQPANSEGEERR
jgi:hypothetical protein